jgi:hypothetical protein
MNLVAFWPASPLLQCAEMNVSQINPKPQCVSTAVLWKFGEPLGQHPACSGYHTLRCNIVETWPTAPLFRFTMYECLGHAANGRA